MVGRRRKIMRRGRVEREGENEERSSRRRWKRGKRSGSEGVDIEAYQVTLLTQYCRYKGREDYTYHIMSCHVLPCTVYSVV